MATDDKVTKAKETKKVTKKAKAKVVTAAAEVAPKKPAVKAKKPVAAPKKSTDTSAVDRLLKKHALIDSCDERAKIARIALAGGHDALQKAGYGKDIWYIIREAL